MHEVNFKDPNNLVHEATISIDEFRKAHLKDKEQAPEGASATQVRWKAPSVGFQKANWDVAVDKINGNIGVRILVRDR